MIPQHTLMLTEIDDLELQDVTYLLMDLDKCFPRGYR